MIKNIFLTGFFALLFVLSLFVVAIKAKTTGFIVVKGSSERPVVADKATWNIGFSVAGNNLEEINKKILNDTENVKLFLKKFDLKEEEINLGQLSFVDNETKEYRDQNQTNRFIITQNIFVQTNNVNALERASRSLTELIKEGVSLKNDIGSNRPIYEFTGIDGIKNSMIEEATKKAKSSAEQFAKDSGSRVGKIKKANQGAIVISPKNVAADYDSGEKFEREKVVRVVTTIEYWLK